MSSKTPQTTRTPQGPRTPQSKTPSAPTVAQTTSSLRGLLRALGAGCLTDQQRRRECVLDRLHAKLAQQATGSETFNGSKATFIHHDDSLQPSQIQKLLDNVSPAMQLVCDQVLDHHLAKPRGANTWVAIVGGIASGKTTAAEQLLAYLRHSGIQCTHVHETTPDGERTAVYKLLPVSTSGDGQVVVVAMCGDRNSPAGIVPLYISMQEDDEEVARFLADHLPAAELADLLAVRHNSPTGRIISMRAAMAACLAIQRIASGCPNGSTLCDPAMAREIATRKAMSAQALADSGKLEGALKLSRRDLCPIPHVDDDSLFGRLLQCLYDSLVRVEPLVAEMTFNVFRARMLYAVIFVERSAGIYSVAYRKGTVVDKMPGNDAFLNVVIGRSSFIVGDAGSLVYCRGTPLFFAYDAKTFGERLQPGCCIVSSVKQNGSYARFGFTTLASGQQFWFVSTKNCVFRVCPENGVLVRNQQLTSDAASILEVINANLTPTGLADLVATGYQSVSICAELLDKGHFVSFDKKDLSVFGARVNNGPLISPADLVQMPRLLELLFVPGSILVTPSVTIGDLDSVLAENSRLMHQSGPPGIEGAVTTIGRVGDDGVLCTVFSTKSKDTLYQFFRMVREHLVQMLATWHSTRSFELVAALRQFMVAKLDVAAIRDFPVYALEMLVGLVGFVLVRLPATGDHSFLRELAFSGFGVGPIAATVLDALPAGDLAEIRASAESMLAKLQTQTPQDVDAVTPEGYIDAVFSLALRMCPGTLLDTGRDRDDVSIPAGALYQGVMGLTPYVTAYLATAGVCDVVAEWREAHLAATWQGTHHITIAYGLGDMDGRAAGRIVRVYCIGVGGGKLTLFVRCVVAYQLEDGTEVVRLAHITIAHSGRPAAAGEEMMAMGHYPIPSGSLDGPVWFTGSIEYAMGESRGPRSSGKKK